MPTDIKTAGRIRDGFRAARGAATALSREQRTLITGAAFAVALAAMLLAVMALTPTYALPVGTSISEGDSMANSGEQVILYADTTPSVGDAVVFDAGSHGFIHHRVVADTGHGFVTQGDAEPANDQLHGVEDAPPNRVAGPYATSENIRGVVYATAPLDYFQMGLGALLAILITGLLATSSRARRGARILIPGRRTLAVGFSVLLVLSIIGPGVIMVPFIQPDHDGTAKASSHIFNATGNSVAPGQGSTWEAHRQGDNGKWYIVWGTEDTVYRYDSNWNYEADMGTGSECNNPLDIQQRQDGKWVLLCSYSGQDQVFIYNEDWSYTGTSHMLDSNRNWYALVQKDDGSWLVLEGSVPEITEWSSDFQTEGNSYSISASDPYGLTRSHTGLYYVLGKTSNTVYEYSDDTFPSYDNTYSLTESDDHRGLAQADDGNWWAGAYNSGADTVYEYTGEDPTIPVTGTVTNSAGDPVEGATVSADHSDVSSTTTASDGSYQLDVPSSGDYTVTATNGSRETSDTFTVPSGGLSGADLQFLNTITGNVTDSDGVDIPDANITLEQDGSVVNSSVTDGSGAYSVSAADGTYTLEVDAAGYVPKESLVDLSGNDPVKDFVLEGNFGGKVVNQDDDPVQGATVEVWGVNYSNIEPKANQTLQDRAEELLRQASDPLPPEWDPNRKLAGSSGEWNNADGKYVGVYGPGDIGKQPWVDTADLSPKLQVPEGEPVHFVVGDPSITKGILGSTNEYDRQVPGAVTDSKGEVVVVEQLDHSGDTVDTLEVEIDQEAGGGYLDPTSLPYGSVHLEPGIYRASPEGSSYQLVFSVGSPREISDRIEQDLRNERDDLTDHSDWVQEQVQQDKFQRTAATTDAQGQFAVSIEGDVDTVGVQAYKGPIELLDKDPGQVRLSDLRGLYGDTIRYNGSVAAPAGVERSGVPGTVTVRVLETEAPSHTDMDRYDGVMNAVRDYLENTGMADTVNDAMDMTDETVISARDELYNLSRSNIRVRDSYAELREEQIDETGSAPPALPDDYSDLPDDPDTAAEQRELLRTAIRDASTGDGMTPGDGDSSVSDGLASATIPWNGEVNPDAVTVMAHYPHNGTSVTVPDQYIRVEDRIARDDVLHVEDYPIGDSPMVSFSATVSGEDGGVGEGRTSARNPAFSGSMLELEHVRVSSINPGPSERVTVEPHAAAASVGIDTVGATVKGPNGEVNTTKTDSTTSRFTTDGAGRYYVTLDITDSQGNTWTDAISLKAGDKDMARPPSVRARQGFTGTYAVVGDGLARGTMKTSGGVVDAKAIADAEDVPGTVHFYTGEMSDNYDVTNLRVLKQSGSGQPETVRKHLKVYLHTDDIPEDAILYRNGNQPLEVDGETAYGQVKCAEVTEGCTIRTYTEGDGSVSVNVIRDPGWVDRAFYTARVYLPTNIDIPFLSVFPAPGATPNLPLYFQWLDALAMAADTAPTATHAPEAVGAMAAGNGGVAA